LAESAAQVTGFVIKVVDVLLAITFGYNFCGRFGLAIQAEPIQSVVVSFLVLGLPLELSY